MVEDVENELLRLLDGGDARVADGLIGVGRRAVQEFQSTLDRLATGPAGRFISSTLFQFLRNRVTAH